MNVKMAATFAAGAACALAAVVVINVAIPSARAQEAPQAGEAAGDADLSSLVTALRQVESEIGDSDTRAYYDKLMAAYDIDNWPTSATQPAASSPGGLLPDINGICRVALTLPLQEAGNRIKDREIAEFYRKFLSDTGLTDPLP